MDEAKALRLAESYLELRRPERALEYLARISLDTPRTWWLRGRALDQLGRSEEAQQAIERGLALSPEEPELHASLALIRAGRNELWPAEEAIREALRLEPSNARHLALLGLILAFGGRADEGESCVRKALALAPEDSRLRYAEVEIAIRLGDYATVRKATDALIAAEPEMADAHSVLGLTTLNPRQALAHLREAIRLDPARHELARAARVASHPLLWLYHVTAPAGSHVARVAFVLAMLGWYFDLISWKVVAGAAAVLLYYILGTIAIPIAATPRAGAAPASRGPASPRSRPTPPPSS